MLTHYKERNSYYRTTAFYKFAFSLFQKEFHGT